MKSKYYEAELAYLREAGAQYARQFPNSAGLLAERSADPDVERILEGFAFLAAQVHERADDAVPEIARQYAELLVPRLNRFVPPLTVLQFAPERGLRTRQTLPRGSAVLGTSPQGVKCQFRTTSPLTLLPLALEDVRHERPQSRVDRLVLSFRSAHPSACGTSPLRLFFRGESGFWGPLRSWFLYCCHSLEVKVGGETVATLDPSAIVGRGYGEEDDLLPIAPLEHDAFSTVADFFCMPEKYAFVDLPPLGTAAGAQFEIWGDFINAPKLPRPPVEGDIRLHCVPAVNLFPVDGRPIRFDPLMPESLVLAENYTPVEAEVWRVDKVTGLASARRTEYPSFLDYQTLPDQAHFFATRRRPSVTASGTDLALSLVSPRDGPPPAEPEVLSIKLTISNRAAATKLSLGDVSEATRTLGTSAPFKNITAVSPPLYPHDDVELVWRLAAHMGISRRALLDAATLRRLLEAYNFAARFNPRLGNLNALWIESIRAVEVTGGVRVHRGAPITGTLTNIKLDGAKIGSTGEAHLLGEVLNELFARRVPINSFNECRLTIVPSGETRTWPPRNGPLTLR